MASDAGLDIILVGAGMHTDGQVLVYHDETYHMADDEADEFLGLCDSN